MKLIDNEWLDNQIIEMAAFENKLYFDTIDEAVLKTLREVKEHTSPIEGKLERAIELLQYFVKKVDDGRAKSFETYNLYKDFLNSINK